jgi:hypothetical protein
MAMDWISIFISGLLVKIQFKSAPAQRYLKFRHLGRT